VTEQKKTNGAAGSRSTAVTGNNLAAQERRVRLAADFRARLVADLAPDGSAARDALVDTAVSCYVEVAELTSRFLRARARGSDMERCSKARAQLSRVLGQLNVAPKSEIEPNAGPSLESWLQNWRTKQKPHDGPIPPDPGPSEVQS
jgi:hypothetical protein